MPTTLRVMASDRAHPHWLFGDQASRRLLLRTFQQWWRSRGGSHCNPPRQLLFKYSKRVG